MEQACFLQHEIQAVPASKNFDRSGRDVSAAAYCGVANNCIGELDTGCHSFTSFLASMFHCGAEIAIAVLERIQQAAETFSLGEPRISVMIE